MPHPRTLALDIDDRRIGIAITVSLETQKIIAALPSLNLGERVSIGTLLLSIPYTLHAHALRNSSIRDEVALAYNLLGG